MGVPPFLLPDGFDAARDIPRFNFQGDLLTTIKARVQDRLPAKTLLRWDRLFDFVTLLIAIWHVWVLYALVAGQIGPPLAAGLWLVTRTALAGAGHYHIHRKKPNWFDALFDMNYVGTCLIAVDGHVLLHHPHLGSGGDVKRTFFDGMTSVHPVFRPVAYSVHKLGVCVTGLFVRGAEFIFCEQPEEGFRPEFWLVRLWLLMELVILALSGHLVFWICQFLVVLWYNTFLVVASHDYTEDEARSQLADVPEAYRSDWAKTQLFLTYDLSITGIRWVDVFLTAGLSPHRAHHLFPVQRSGFANIASEAVIKEVALENGLEWRKPKNLILDRFPKIIRHYLGIKNQPVPRLPEWFAVAKYCKGGLLGVGAV